MKILALMATYGRFPELIENGIQSFLDQAHKDKFLLIYDDLGNVKEQSGENWAVISTTERAPSLSMKYNIMIELAKKYGDFDAYAVWDDDDLFLKYHLLASNQVLENGSLWSKPSLIRSTYQLKDGKLHTENAAGRFHSSIVVSKELYQKVQWPDTKKMEYDQLFLANCSKIAKPGDYCEFTRPNYVYCWGLHPKLGYHCSVVSGENWYDNYKPKYNSPIGVLNPKYTPQVQEILDKN